MPSSSCAVPVLPAKLIGDAGHGVPRRAFGHHPPHRARRGTPPARRQDFERRVRARALLSSSIQRPCGIRPPAAIVAATRAILNGEISTSPCPYAAKGSDLPQLRGIAGRDAHLRRRFGQRLRPHIVHAQLREVRVAGDGDGALHVDGAVGVVADIVLDRPVPAGDHVARAPVGQRLAEEGAMAQRRGRRAGRDGGHQLEGGARRILAVARAVEQLVVAWARRCGCPADRAPAR